MNDKPPSEAAIAAAREWLRDNWGCESDPMFETELMSLAVFAREREEAVRAGIVALVRRRAAVFHKDSRPFPTYETDLYGALAEMAEDIAESIGRREDERAQAAELTEVPAIFKTPFAQRHIACSMYSQRKVYKHDVSCKHQDEFEEAGTTSAETPCKRCGGSGKTKELSFVDPEKRIEKDCYLCHGTGKADCAGKEGE